MAAVARKVNWFAIWVSVAVVVVLVLVAVLIVNLSEQPSADEPGEVPRAANVDFETGAINVGEGENTLDTYIDFMCPVCNQFEQLYGPDILTLVAMGMPMYLLYESCIWIAWIMERRARRTA